MRQQDLSGIEVKRVTVDAGCIWIGDPCYVMGEDSRNGPKTWADMCDRINHANHDETGISEPLGEGVGVLTESGYGDGEYAVTLHRNREGRVSRVVINFMQDDFDENDD